MLHITPQLAEKWLTMSGPNRPVHQATVERFAADMQDGTWVLNGDRIRFDEEGLLRDGRHRLSAIVLSGKAVPMEVVYGLSESAIQTVDTGRTRTFADALFIEDMPNVRALAATARWIWRYENDRMLAGWRQASHAELRDVLDRHEIIHEAIRDVQRSKEVQPHSAIAFVHTLAKESKPRKAMEWLDSLQSGENLVRTNPVWHLRRRLMSREAVTSRMRPLDAAALIVKAWNAFSANESMSSLTWNAKEDFPAIR